LRTPQAEKPPKLAQLRGELIDKYKPLGPIFA
jgi:hypothetical protein